MSLQQILQGYSQDISASQNHNNELADDNRARKAESMEDQFAHHLDALTSASTELGTASGAIHMGRKVYRKFKEGKATYKKVEDLINKVKKAASGGDKPTGEEGDGGSGEGVEPTRPLGSQEGDRDAADGGASKDGASKTATQDGGSGAGDGTQPVSEDTIQSVTRDSNQVNQRFKQLPEESQVNLEQQYRLNPLRVENPETPQDYRTNLNLRSQAVSQEEERLGSNSAPKAPEAQGEVTPASQPAPQPEAQPQPATQPAPEASEQNLLQKRPATLGEAPESEPFNFRNVVPGEGQPFSQPKALGRAVGKTAPNLESSAPQITGRAEELQQGTQKLGGAIDGTLQKAGAAVQDTINGVKSSVGNLVQNTASKVGNAVKSVLPESVGDFLGSGAGEVLSAGLDAIPVVGEIASVVTGLVSLFEGLHHKAKPDEDLTGTPISQATTAIDPSALTKDQPTMGATIV